MATKAELMELLATGFNKFMYDQFLSTDQIYSAITGTAEVTDKLMELRLNTGTLANSTAIAYYNNNIFNPYYATAYFHLFLDNLKHDLEGNIKDVFMFFGFKQSSAAPTWNMTENHSGFMIHDGKLYSSTGDGSNQQLVEITGIDPTRDMIYKIEYNRFSTFPLPQVIPYFDTFHIITPDRIWTHKQTNTTIMPADQLYYLMFYITSTTGAEKILRVKAVTYGEMYAD